MSCSASPRDHHPVRVRRRRLCENLLLSRPLPRFDVSIAPPDLTPWMHGNTGIAGVMQFQAPRPGPHVVMVSLMHGNEFASAIALDRLMRSGVTPRNGTISIVFGNLEAFARFDPANPAASRFIDEDMNRLWDEKRLHSQKESRELTRARALLPIIASADILIDMHSMLWESDPLLITPDTQRSVELASALVEPQSAPRLVLTDLGHAGGPRLIEQTRFTRARHKARSVLLEAGRHWEETTVDTSYQVARKIFEVSGDLFFGTIRCDALPEAPERAVVTDNVIARSATFTFTHPYRGGEVVSKAGTVIAQDGVDEICTPYDRCLLIMPNLYARRGQLAIRLARYLRDDHAPG
ncbi:M14 family metallopeptidase [Brytella acorum]|uniref:Succinylglutamate desuccinylase/aspartoacylase family protein n=1 Tax=Brytella acorum TaxID=2959299 RepID=A0AA35Y3X1_9PROT|nr:succinylglutamate desuccinylase/aspartoacylase family protein [Brytella acorum]MDF3624074.1 succinylglutamate desuccinylase/aspartoacylase family protein [Brytella acorum]CAI9120603.1 succinylglutamate desuccinylase/aspartoacylase family protein [Brytella acorum]